jgi:preprotein translocase subunit SecF
MKFSFVRSGPAFLLVSAVLVIISLVLLVYPGPELSIEFTGGTLMEMQLPDGKAKEDLETALSTYQIDGKNVQNVSIAQTKTKSFFIRMQPLSNEQHLDLVKHLESTLGTVKEVQYTTIGPTVGSTLKKRSLISLSIATIAIILYVALAFRKVPRKLSPWRFGVIAVLALLHDILITVGIFTILSKFTTFQVDTLFISALLSIMGYSVNDTIVIFDRIRENLQQERGEDIGTIAERSLWQTLTRTFNTGLGALIMLFAFFFLGSESIRWFILTLILGTVIGTYSSFFVATPLLVFWKKRS